jgi:predicted transcriptional regulator
MFVFFFKLNVPNLNKIIVFLEKTHFFKKHDSLKNYIWMITGDGHLYHL